MADGVWDAALGSSASMSMAVIDSQRLASVAVRDHGPGVPAHMLTRLLDPFFRVDTPATGGAAGPAWAWRSRVRR
jgi:signal transduction histidine kinase